jgi:hypothetical protein
MVAYEFLTRLTKNGVVIVPQRYRRKLNKVTSVRVILLVEEVADDETDNATPEIDETTELDQIIARIQQLGPNPNNVTPASGLLAQHLAELMQSSDPTLDVAQWQQEWDKVEAAMEAEEAVHEQAEWSMSNE